jgi:hypothetical protein
LERVFADIVMVKIDVGPNTDTTRSVRRGEEMGKGGEE